MTFNNLTPSNEHDRGLKMVLEYVSSLRVPASVTKEEMWDDIRLSERITESTKSIAQGQRRKNLIYYSIAAILGLFISSYFFIKYCTIHDYFAPKGRQITLSLPDGSEVNLNSDSRLSYKSYNWKENRYVSLQGEAFFTVAPGKKFTVNCNGNYVTVVGTSFNVSSRKQQFKVECVTGKVKVKVGQIPEEYMITRGKAIAYTNDKPVKLYDINPEHGGAWTRGEYLFSHESLDNVFKELERQFDVTISHPDIDDRVYTGCFNTANLQQALDMVCLPMKLNYQIIDKHTVIIK